MINEKYRVFCLSSEPDDELMWAHYTSKHQGICLEFDTKNELFSFALKVTYHEDYPVLDLTSTAVEQTLAPFLTKSQAWEYESEYRIVAREDKIDPPSSFPVTKNNFLKIPDGALTSIIVGCMVEDSTISEIKNVIEQSTQPIELKYARQVRDQFKLSIT